MNYLVRDENNNNKILGVLTGLLIGGLAGALAMLFFVPRSGKITRFQIRNKSLEWHDKATGIVEEAMGQVFQDRNKIVMGKVRDALTPEQMATHQAEREANADQFG